MAVNFPLTALLCLSGALLTTGAAVEYDHGCSDGWTHFGTRCFKFFDSKATWTEAEKICQTHGANLASVHSAEEHSFITGLIKTTSGENRQTWIGGQDAVKEDVWMWSDGSVWDYSKWAPGEPNNWKGQDHVTEIYYEGTYWNDLPENIARDYICAKAVPPNPEPVSLNVGSVLYQCSPNTQ